MLVMPSSSSSSLASAPHCIIWLNVICSYCQCIIICTLLYYIYTLPLLGSYHKLSGINETHLLAHRSLLRASQGWNPGADQVHPHLGLGLLFWGHFSLLADFSSHAYRAEVPVALLAGSRGPFSAFRDHPRSLHVALLIFKANKGGCHLCQILHRLQISHFLWPLFPDLKGIMKSGPHR